MQKLHWVRAKDGAIFGVCKGVARALDIPVGLCRLLWLVSVLFLGAGLGIYLMLALTLPREDKVDKALEPWILGVCARLARRSHLEVGVLRFLALALSLLSFGATIVGYLVLYFVLEEPTSHSGQSSASNPSTPPATT